MTDTTLWQRCCTELERSLTSQQYNTWIRPLQAIEKPDHLLLLAPNRFVRDRIEEHFADDIRRLLVRFIPDVTPALRLDIGSMPSTAPASADSAPPPGATAPAARQQANDQYSTPLNPDFTFDTYVEGKSNQVGRAAAMQVAMHPDTSYNPLLIYGGTGLGKTHLMHAVGNMLLQQNPNARIAYLHSERYVAEMVKALQNNRINEFKRYYRSVNALLIDDIQFFAGKERSQEEFFHTFNALLDSRQQVIMTCDRYPKEVENLEDRLKSRFGWGLTVAVEPPELETRVAILMSKAQLAHIELPHEVAFFIAKRIRSNIRELEGALRRVFANSLFTGQPITLEFTKEALRDLLALQDRLVTIDNIQRTVADYYKLRMADLTSRKRTRSIARPRQMAMALSKELTNHSLPEIGEAFGGRDHTTVLHGCRKIAELREADNRISEDYRTLSRILTT